MHIRPIPTLLSVQHFWEKLAGSTQDAILKTRHTHRQIVLSGQRFLRQSARASTNFQPLPLWVAGQT